MSLQQREVCFVLFETNMDAMTLDALFRADRIPARISPVPHGTGLRPGCGVALLLDKEHLEAARTCIAQHNASCFDIVCMQSRINPRRDKFC